MDANNQTTTPLSPSLQPTEKMTRKAWKAPPLTLRNKPGRGDAALVQIGPLSIPVTFVCEHGELEKTRCLKCEEASGRAQ